ncbi:MAG: class IV adenylate cyclase [Candidatus Aenigmarchaeota archaeon]|nr:class IV adenylate cyclase [Candidatus Aenigmarchaeota archaeon]
MDEIEAKILEIDERKVIERIKSLGGKKVFEGEIKTYIFDTEDRKLKNSGSQLRIRDINGKFVLGMKIEKSRGKTKVMDEYEVTVENFDTMKKILKSLGYYLIETIKKYRVSYRIEGCRIDIDRVEGIPTFLEIEGSDEEKVVDCTNLLGFSEKDLKPWTIFDVLEKYKA